MSALTYCDRQASSADAASYTFPGLSFGPEDGTRQIAIGLVWRSAGTSNSVTGLTIDGIPATRLALHYNDGGGNRGGAEFWVAALPAGASGTVIVSFGSTATRCGVVVYSLIGLSSDAIAASNGSSTGAFTLSLAAPAHVIGINHAANNDGYRLSGAHDDFAIGSPGISVALSGSNIAWTGLSEDIDILVENVPATSSQIALVAAWTLEAQAVVTGDITLSGAATGRTEISGAAGGSLPLAGTAEGGVGISGEAASSLPLSGSGAGTIEVSGSGAGILPLLGSASGTGQDVGHNTIRPTVGRPGGNWRVKRPIQPIMRRPSRIAIGRR